jgi:hypothetical protein
MEMDLLGFVGDLVGIMREIKVPMMFLVVLVWMEVMVVSLLGIELIAAKLRLVLTEQQDLRFG